MWWMLGQKFFSLPVVRRLRETRGRGDSGHHTRVMCLVMMLTYSASGWSWPGHSEMAEDLKIPEKEAERTWNICVEEGILRDVSGGKNAEAWMAENGLVGQKKEEKTPHETKQPTVTSLASTTKNFFI